MSRTSLIFAAGMYDATKTNEPRVLGKGRSGQGSPVIDKRGGPCGFLEVGYLSRTPFSLPVNSKSQDMSLE